MADYARAKPPSALRHFASAHSHLLHSHVTDDELEEIQLESNHTIEIDRFVPAVQIDKRFYDSASSAAPKIERSLNRTGTPRCRPLSKGPATEKA
jgi:hypothetical protein